MQLVYMREFLVLAETQSFSEAAKRLYISQPSLSKHVMAMEKELGTPLLRRTTHDVVLTENGASAAKTFRKMLSQYDALLHGIENRAGELSGRIVIGILYYSMARFAALIPLLRQKYPAVDIELKTYQPHELYRDILSGKVDVGEMPTGDFLVDGRLRLLKHGRSGMIVILRSDHPLAGRDRLTLDELRQETLIALSDDDYSRQLTDELLDRRGFAFAGREESPNIETVADMIRAQGGVHLTGENCKNQCGCGLSYVPIADKGFMADDAFVWLSDNPNPLVPVIVQAAAEQIGRK